MSRGGRFGGGGGRGGAGSMGGQMLPFEVDTALESEIAAYREAQDLDEADEWIKQLYPAMKVFTQPPPSAYERRLVAKRREHRAAMRNGPFFIDAPKTGKRDLSSFNAFEDVATYVNKRAKRQRGLPNLKKLPIVVELLPAELRDLANIGEADGVNGAAPKKNLDWLRKKRIDKLAQFDDGVDIDTAPVADDDDEAPKNDENEGEDDVEEPVDDDFSEDDDDVGNDYNAEKYFDDGDADDDDGGGEDGYGDD